ncbi:MAG TPA: sulfurtransferase [Steroidobacteraceae bacterium]|nr:sulfurtransferase [Steroidobacteraceae bacterium]
MSTTPVPPLVQAAGLAALLDSPGILVVDCRFDLADAQLGPKAYAQGHVPGAVFASMDHDLAAPRTARTGRHPLPSPAAFARLLGSWGFTPASRVIVYDQGSGAGAARLWWMLRARGHSAVQVLDGGWAAWLAHGGPVSARVPDITPTQVQEREFSGVFSASEAADAVAARRIVLVDARAPERFSGQSETIDPVAGHVPGARNHPYTRNLRDGQHWLTPGELRQQWAPLLEQAANRPMVMMCGSGVTACHNLLALELAGHCGGQLYAGSWSEWITDPARPVATGEDP